MEIDEIESASPAPSLIIDTGTMLLIKIDGISMTSIKSYFVGMEIDEYIAIKHPFPFASIKHKIFPGSQFVIRYLYKGSIYAFQTKVIDIIYKPVRLVFLEYPQMVADRNIRSAKRTQAFIPGILNSKKFTTDVVFVDISKKGCRLQFLTQGKDRQTMPRKDDAVTIDCRFPGLEGDRSVGGVIRNFEKKKDSLTLGIEFIDVSREFQNAIGQYVLALEEFN